MGKEKKMLGTQKLGPFLAILVSRHLGVLSECNERAREKAYTSRKDLSASPAQAGRATRNQKVPQ